MHRPTNNEKDSSARLISGSKHKDELHHGDSTGNRKAETLLVSQQYSPTSSDTNLFART